jgi:bis(5'-nucleosyl)-tetraphosphatase (symmetrical)
MIYLIGDLQGCCDPFERLLERIDFSPSRDHLYLLGDLVNRGPQSLSTLRRLQGLGSAATCLLGNHDLHLLAASHGVRTLRRSDTLRDVLDAPDHAALLAWLRHCRLAVYEHGWLMVHAGVAPPWELAQVLQLAGEVEACLQSQALPDFLRVMYGNEPARWDDKLTGDDRLRFIVNALTRVRFVTRDGALILDTKDPANQAQQDSVPWSEAPGRRTQGVPIAFGHWSTLGLVNRPDLLALDTGCVWGGQLTAVRIDGGRREVIQVACQQAQRPG